MIFNRLSLWNFIIRRMAKAHGFIDPQMLFAQIQKFSRPSEVWVPAELLRSGMILQARGLLNSQAIQNNLDWIWPFWVYQQFDPRNTSFIPRAFNLTHINLTHRNWTAIGIPDFSHYSLVDPRGLVTPFFDGWSLDAWIIKDNTKGLIPAQLPQVSQQIRFEEGLEIITCSVSENMNLKVIARVSLQDNIPVCKITYVAHSEVKSSLLICVRPYNPEGVSLINTIQHFDHPGWNVNNQFEIFLKTPPKHYIFSNYQIGDVLNQVALTHRDESVYEDKKINCSVGMATAAAIYEIVPHQSQEVMVEIPLTKNPLDSSLKTDWGYHLKDSCTMEIPDQLFKFLYDIALRTLILHSPKDIYPGPYTYKRFWFRDAAYIIYTMAAVNLIKNIEKILEHYPERQTLLGYFDSQDGEWDSNGQAIWAIERFCSLTGRAISPKLLASVESAVRWIQRKRVTQKVQSGHAGLMPAGFSAEHFGPTDFYYWDDFWSLSGILSAASLMEHQHHIERAQEFRKEANEFKKIIEESLKDVQEHLSHSGIPASPYRRMDAGAIGSLVASYPLQILPAEDKSILATADFLMKKYFLNGVYYHELSHSGINIYMTLELAQVLLRAGNPHFFDIVQKVAELATPTGQWPEAIHPLTKGGCMGDGQHIWAAAEWVMMMRNMFVREEEKDETVILCSGIPRSWLQKKQRLFFGPTNTIFGSISVTVDIEDVISVSWEAPWRQNVPKVEIRLAGYESSLIQDRNINCVKFQPHNGKVYVT